MNTEKTLTTKQQSFLDHLVSCGGDTQLAAEMAGYSKTSHAAVIKSLRSEILELAESILAYNAPRAAMSLINTMTSSEPIPQANIRLQAAQTLLDRVGISKKDKLDIEINGGGGLFILPAKQQAVVEGEWDEYEE